MDPPSFQITAILLGITTILYLVLRTLYNLSTFTPYPPSPAHAPVRKMELAHLKYGPILRVAPDAVCFAAAEAWNDMMQPPPGRPETILKDTQWFYPLPGMAVAMSQAVDPPSHAHIKKHIQPAFTARALRTQEPFIQRYVNLLIERLTDIANKKTGKETEVDIVSWLNFATFDIFGDLGFGESFGCLENARYHPWVNLIFSNFKGVALMRAISYFPTLDWILNRCIPPSIRKMQDDHVQFVRERVKRRLNYEFEREDIMSHVYRGGELEKAGEEGLDGETITSVFWEMVMAGSETTATTLAGTIVLLIQNPDKLRLLEEELRGKFARESCEDVGLNELQDLPYLNAVLKEGLRMCPPFPWILPRVIPKGGATICGASLPGGTKVSIHTVALQRSTAYFHDPHGFHPERWLQSALTDTLSPFFNDRRDAAQTFLVGPRACVGQSLAWAELRLILAKLVWSFDLSLPVDETKRIKWEDLRAYIVIEKPPIHVALKPRRK
ncbi:hypothetical protein OQA88_8936 [Cercophora sp. LCS_1]